jgi:hypothetical protein
MGRLALLLGVATLIAAPQIRGGPQSSATPIRPPGPARFVPRVDNRWFPLRPGATYVYRGVKDGLPSRDVFTVTAAKKAIQGVGCTVVQDRLYLRGRLRERTEDWYAQDTAGNVWYFGEATAELSTNGKVTSTEGSWQAGVNGARAGVFMPAHPHPGQAGRQESYPGHAEDRFRVLSRTASVDTPAARSHHALLIREWTPLEPGVVDHKLYVRGVGNVLEQTVKGGDERNELVARRSG